MPLYGFKVREYVYRDRIYEVEANSFQEAYDLVEKGRNDDQFKVIVPELDNEEVDFYQVEEVLPY